MSNFPPLRLAVLTGLVGIKDNLSSLDDENCPYDNETKEALKRLLAPVVVDNVITKEVHVTGGKVGRPTKDIRLSEDDQRLVLDNIKETMENLKAMKGDGLETSEKIQIAKTQTALLDQLLKMMERHTTVARTQEFQETVIGILDSLVTEEDRETFLAKIEPFR